MLKPEFIQLHAGRPNADRLPILNARFIPGTTPYQGWVSVPDMTLWIAKLTTLVLGWRTISTLCTLLALKRPKERL